MRTHLQNYTSVFWDKKDLHMRNTILNTGIFCDLRGHQESKLGPIPKEFSWHFPIFEKNPNLQKSDFFWNLWFFYSVKIHKKVSYMVKFFFNLCNRCFLLIKNDIIVRYNKFPNLGVYQATFPNLKGLGPLPKIAKKKNPCNIHIWKLTCDFSVYTIYGIPLVYKWLKRH